MENRAVRIISDSDLQLLNNTWVNIVDLVECRAAGKKVPRHASQKALREYTRRTEKIFRKQDAKRNGFLKALLIKVY
jgi:hypothetical protein